MWAHNYRIHIHMHAALNEQTANVVRFSLEGQVHWAKCVKTYDGDSIHIVIHFKGGFARFPCRLEGIDTAELRSNNDAERAHAEKARDYLRSRVGGRIVLVHCGGWDKYGRLLVTVFVPNDEGASVAATTAAGDVDLASSCTNINDELVRRKFAYAYEGYQRKTFEEWFAPL